MSKTRKTPASAATLTGAVENGTACKTAHASTKDSTTSSAERQTFRVADLLAIPRRDLMALTCFLDRELRLRIEAERRKGIPILSDCIHG